MAVETRFKCTRSDKDYLIVDSVPKEIVITCFEMGIEHEIYLDVKTAIKFAKTLRTEINKIKEVDNGNR